MIDVKFGELAVVRDNGNTGAFRVNFDLVNSKLYHDRFEKLTAHKTLDEALYKRATLMLEHRSGTPYEDIAMLDSRTGYVLMENTMAAGTMLHRCSLTLEQAKILRTLENTFEILHNHPGSSRPSSADIRGLFMRDKASGSTVVCHNGDVYRIAKLKQLANVEGLIAATYKNAMDIHPNWSAPMIEDLVTESLLERLTKAKIITYTDRR